MLIKVLLLIALGGAFVWWQFHDLAQEKKRREAKEKRFESDDNP